MLYLNDVEVYSNNGGKRKVDPTDNKGPLLGHWGPQNTALNCS